MFKKMKLGAKMFTGFAVVLALLCVVAFFGYLGLDSVVEGEHQLRGLDEVAGQVNQTRQYQQEYMLRSDPALADKVRGVGAPGQGTGDPGPGGVRPSGRPGRDSQDSRGRGGLRRLL